MNAHELLLRAKVESRRRAYFIRLEVLDSTEHLVKLRMYLSPELFVQIYRNDRFGTTNLALIYNNERLYARDETAGDWHRHPASNPDEHDFSLEGQRFTTLSEFLDEVEIILAQLDLP